MEMQHMNCCARRGNVCFYCCNNNSHCHGNAPNSLLCSRHCHVTMEMLQFIVIQQALLRYYGNAIWCIDHVTKVNLICHSILVISHVLKSSRCTEVDSHLTTRRTHASKLLSPLLWKGCSHSTTATRRQPEPVRAVSAVNRRPDTAQAVALRSLSKVDLYCPLNIMNTEQLI
jgi:hypothetical protein